MKPDQDRQQLAGSTQADGSYFPSGCTIGSPAHCKAPKTRTKVQFLPVVLPELSVVVVVVVVV